MRESQDIQGDLDIWAAWIRKHRFVSIAMVLLHLVDILDLAGEQLTWAVMPFLNQNARTTLARLIDHPEFLQQLQEILAEGDG